MNVAFSGVRTEKLAKKSFFTQFTCHHGFHTKTGIPKNLVIEADHDVTLIECTP